MLTSLTNLERRIMEEAYMCGMVFEGLIDKPKPAEEYKRLEKACIRAANRKTDTVEAVEQPLTGDKSKPADICSRCNGAGVLSSQGADVCCPSCGGTGK